MTPKDPINPHKYDTYHMYTEAVLNNSQNHGILYLPIVCTWRCK